MLVQQEPNQGIVEFISVLQQTGEDSKGGGTWWQSKNNGNQLRKQIVKSPQKNEYRSMLYASRSNKMVESVKYILITLLIKDYLLLRFL